MANPSTKRPSSGAVQTTGHAWDGDLQEFNNPLPHWWLWAFYATVAFALIYWVLYPAWPVGKAYTTGLNSITYEVDGEAKTTHWNTRARFIKEMQESPTALRQKKHLGAIAAVDYEQILSDPEMMSFTRSLAKGLFGDNCAACHGGGGTGIVARYPNLADDDWLWGGTVETIEQTLRDGRRGFMPSFKGVFSEEQLDSLAEHVLSLSGIAVDGAQAARGRELFNGQAGGCHYCHTREGTGLPSQGAANLTDRVWTLIDVPAAADHETKKALVKQVITQGVDRIMPAWEDRLSPAEIKLLTVYVHALGGGQ